MMTSEEIFPTRLTTVDDLTRKDHYYLTEDHSCHYLGEYTARKGFSFSKTNSLILNFKKTLDRKSREDWKYKSFAIKEAANALGCALGPNFLERTTLVPVPPSKSKTDPLYDDRVLKMLHKIPAKPELDIRDLIVQDQTLEASHDASQRIPPEELAKHYSLVESECTQAVDQIALFDDVITTGSHFVAASNVLQKRFPEAQIFGIFIARRAPETSDFSEFEDWDEE